MTHPEVDRDCWFASGLRFACTACGDCCGGEPGYIWVTPEDVRRMAEVIGMDLESFHYEYVRRVGNRLTLTEARDGYCVMYKHGVGCRVYDVRPVQCRTYPWWSRTLANRQSWDDESKRCRGMNHGPLHDVEHINRNTWDNG